MIPDAVLAEIYDHARAVFPAECCGYLKGEPLAVVRCTNAAADDPVVPGRDVDTAFAIDGAELIAFARSFDTAAPARIVYHSHTNGRAYFSTVDQAAAAGPAYPVQHLVVGISAEGVRECALFTWSGGAFVEVARW